MEKKLNMKNDKKAVDELMEVLKEKVKFYRTPTNQLYMEIDDPNMLNTLVLVEEAQVLHWIRSHCYEIYGQILTSAECKQIQDYFKMLAYMKGEEIKLFHRVMKENDAIYYDFGSRTEVLKIDREEISYIPVKKPMFIRNKIFKAQTEPKMATKPREFIGYLKKHFNLKEEKDCILLSTFLVSCFWGKEIFHPILQVFGEKGSAKSTSLRRIQDLIDPHTIDLYALPKKEDDVAICLSSNYMTCFDNVSYISYNISDLLCRNCTGGVQMKRELFSNTGQSILELQSIVCFNGTGQNISKSDLADRTLFVELERIKSDQIRTEKELKEAWKEDLSDILGALYNAVQGVLRDESELENTCPIRLIDFYKVAVKAGKQFGYTEEEVRKAFVENKIYADKEIVTGTPILNVIVEILKTDKNIEMSMTEFYAVLKDCFIKDYAMEARAFPKAPNYLSRYLNENRSNLYDLGISYEIKNTGKFRKIHIWLMK